MPFPSLFRRGSRRILVLEANPLQILVAGVRESDDGPATIECAAEFDPGDDTGLRTWLNQQFGSQRKWLPVYSSFMPPEAILQRESLQPRKLSEPGYLAELLRARNPFHQPEQWLLTALDPLDGTPLAPEGTARPGLFFALPHEEIQRNLQRFFDHRLLPNRLEYGLLSLFGAISDLAARNGKRSATVVVVIEQDHTRAYIIGKEGVHTLAPVSHGFSSITRAVRREFGLEEEGEVRAMLNHAEDDLLLRATKFVREIGRDLKPLVDSYEMTTGQPVGEIYCAYLPGTLQWIAEPLAQVMQRSALTLDCMQWLPGAGLQAAETLPPLGPQWLGALSLITTPPATPETAGSNLVPWRLDCRLSSALPNTRLVRRRFAATAIATTLALFTLTLAAWQAYAIRTLDEDTAYWNQQMDSNRQLFGELTRATQTLRTKSARFDHAYELVRMPHQPSDLILNLGRSLPPNMQVNRIEANPGRMTMSGTLREAPEQSSRTLGRYMEELRQAPAIGPLFSSIALTSLQRENDTDDALIFEITFTIAEATP